jgi:hypothetical protein
MATRAATTKSSSSPTPWSSTRSMTPRSRRSSCRMGPPRTCRPPMRARP